jgi:hypothetical protein
MLDREEADVDLSLSHLFSKEDVHLELKRGKLGINCQVIDLETGKVVGLSLLVMLAVIQKGKVESAQDLFKVWIPAEHLNHSLSDEGKSFVDRFKGNPKPYRGQIEKILQQPSSFRDRICAEIQGRPETYRQRGNTFSWRNWIFWQPEEENGEGSIQTVTTGQELGEGTIQTAGVTRQKSYSSIDRGILADTYPDAVTGTDEDHTAAVMEPGSTKLSAGDIRSNAHEGNDGSGSESFTMSGGLPVSD